MLVIGKQTGQWDSVQARDDAARFNRQASWIHNRVIPPGMNKTVNIDHINAGYYSIRALNPKGIVPARPALPGTLSKAAYQETTRT